jgi:phage/plasmid-associated DNA primase
MQETQKGDRVNEGVMKQLTSGMDTIEGRGLYMANVEVFYPQFKMVLCSNYLMDIKSNDHGTWRRIRVVPFKSLFTENPVEGDQEKPYQFKIDLSLRERCKGWSEVFAALLVDIAYGTQGYVKDCDAVLAASNAYRQSQDYIAEFVGDNITIDPRGSITKTELSVRYKMWYESTYGRGAPNVKEVQAYMDKKFKKADKKWVGVTFSQGSRDASVLDDDVPDDEYDM